MGDYLDSCQSEFWKEVFERELEYLIKELKWHTNILSVGCGPAIIERGLQDNGLKVTGLDVSREALGGALDSIRTIVGTAEDMKFPDLSFDAVIYVASLQFVDDYRKAVDETARVLRGGGKIIAMLLNPESDFFRQRTLNADSYMNKIKHTSLEPIEKAIGQYFSVRTDYYLGIQNNKLFESQDPKLAALYIIQGFKK